MCGLTHSVSPQIQLLFPADKSQHFWNNWPFFRPLCSHFSPRLFPLKAEQNPCKRSNNETSISFEKYNCEIHMHYWENNNAFLATETILKSFAPFSQPRTIMTRENQRREKTLTIHPKPGTPVVGKRKKRRKKTSGERIVLPTRKGDILSFLLMTNCNALSFSSSSSSVQKTGSRLDLRKKVFFGFADWGKRNYRLFSFAFFFRGNSRECNRSKTDGKGGAEWRKKGGIEKIAGPQGWEKYVSLSLLSSRRGGTEIHPSTGKWSLAFLPAAKPSGPRTVGVVVLVGGREQFVWT